MRHKKVLFSSLVILFVAVLGTSIYAYLHVRGSQNSAPKPPQTVSRRAAPAPAATSASSVLAHVVIIVEENKPKDTIVGNSAAPYLNSLMHTYAMAQNYYGVTHPSLPNYLALTSGTFDGITTDCNPPGGACEANVKNIADEIEQSGRTWKEYAESMPSPCYQYNSGEYAVKHNPFMYYPDITSNPARCNSHVVPFSTFSKDLASTTSLPNYSFITPNLCNDMHNCSVQTGDQWLAKIVPAILNSPGFTKQRSLLAIVWDEGYVGNNNVLAILAGSAVKKGYVSTAYYNHYSLLHTIEYLWGLSPLTANDRNAPLMTSMLN